MRLDRRFLSYGVALSATTIALFLSLWLEALIAQTIGAFFYIATAISTWYGGRRPGLVVVFLAAPALNYFFIPPLYQFHVTTVNEGLRLVLIVMVGLIINLLTANLQTSQRVAVERIQLLEQEQIAHAEAERLLRQLETERHWLQQVLQQMPVGVAIAAPPSGKLSFYNEEAIRLLRHPLPALDSYQGYLQYGAMHQDGRPYQPEEYPLVRALLQGETVKAEEMTYRRGDGTITLLAVSAAPIRDQAGQMISTVTTFNDIGDRKQLELALQASEAKLSQILHYARASIVSLRMYPDFTWEYDYYSAGCEQVFGYTPAEMVAGLWWSRIPPDDQELVIQPAHAAILEERPMRIEYRFQHKDGSMRWISTNLTSYRDEENQCWRAIAVDTDVTDRRLAEEALKRSEYRLQQMATAAPGVFFTWVYTPEQGGRYEYLNPYFERTHEIPVAAALADYTLTVQQIHPHDLDGYLQAIAHSLETQQAFRHEWRIITDSGQVKWLYASAQPELRDNGEQAWHGVGLDLSDLKQVELALHELNRSLEQKVAERTTELRASEAQIRAIMEAIPDLLLHVTRDGRCLDCIYPHPSTTRWLTVPTHLSELLPTDLLHLQLARIEQAIATNTLQIYEHQLPKAGDIAYEEVRIVGLNEDEALVIVRDISDRKRAEISLQESQRFVQQIADASPNLLYVYDIQQQRNLYANRETATVLGYTPENIQAMGAALFQTLMHPDDLARLPVHHQRIYESQEHEIVEFEYRMRQVNGEWRWLYSRDVVFRRDASGQVQQIIGTAQDITHLKQSQQLLTEQNQQLALMNQELARATRLKDEFLANMSHELRTPLNAILGMTEGLQEAVFGDINEQQRNALRTVEQTGLHLLALINDILDLAKIESGQVDLDYAPTNVALLCHSSLDFIKQQAFKKQIRIELKSPFELPDILVDERRLRQALINLLNNAVKFTPSGGCVTLEVSQLMVTHAASGQNGLRFAVQDTGIGIEPDNMAKLFQPFIQIDSALNRQYEGTGLGLGMVKRIVELHGGQVGLTSEVGVGSCFTIDLPGVICSPALAEPLVVEAVSPDFYVWDEANAPLILLVEDNEENVATIASYLKVQGYRLLIAHNGVDAIALTQSQQPDLILMDIQMPGMDGLEAIHRIRCLPEQETVPIIALTALAMKGDRDRCLAVGANDYLSKPVPLKRLIALMQQLLAPA